MYLIIKVFTSDNHFTTNLLKPIYVGILWLCHTAVLSQVPHVTLPKPASLQPEIIGFDTPTNTTQSIIDPFNANANNKAIMQEVDEHIALQQRQREIVEEAAKELNKTRATGGNIRIDYELRGRDIPGREMFYYAYREMEAMLSGQQPLSLKKAVFLYEKAYNPSLDWQAYNDKINGMVEHLGYAMQQEGVKESNNLGKNMMLFNFFTDTLTVNHPGKEKPVTTYPMLYDFHDFWGRNDYNNQFVTKLLQSGSGQCHSLPLLYLILAEETGTQAHLAFSPSHSYIKIQDGRGQWYNMELTNHTFTTDYFLMQSGFIKAEALANGIYLQPLSTREVMGQMVMDLAGAFVHKFGYEDFVLACARLAQQSGVKSMAVHQQYFNYYLNLHNHILNQYKSYGLTKADFENDETAMKVYGQVVGSHKHIERQGYVEMPAEQYKAWLNSVQEEGRKQEH
ncbi:hypothetical protein, partial [Fulvivirga kasyanovii]|uniref:hypothetical protein n=2 Tax=Fulvivirga kasyanovii TaxID=396812 RepID=UPI0031E18980